MSNLIENPETYFGQFMPQRSQLLAELEKEARRERIPIVGPLVGELLHILARAVRADRILELGTAAGYSTIFLARALSSSRGKVVTVESDPAMAESARANFHRAGLSRQIDVVVGNAQAELSEMSGPFDFVFLDIDKADYAVVLPDCQRLIRPAGMLVADNVAFKDADAFNRLIFNSLKWRSVSLFAYLPRHSPEKDGLCLALRV